jgi:hypothetical protein
MLPRGNRSKLSLIHDQSKREMVLGPRAAIALRVPVFESYQLFLGSIEK